MGRLRKILRLTESTYARVMRTKYEMEAARADDVVSLLLDFWEKRGKYREFMIAVGKVSALKGLNPEEVIVEALSSVEAPELDPDIVDPEYLEKAAEHILEPFKGEDEKPSGRKKRVAVKTVK